MFKKELQKNPAETGNLFLNLPIFEQSNTSTEMYGFQDQVGQICKRKGEITRILQIYVCVHNYYLDSSLANTYTEPAKVSYV